MLTYLTRPAGRPIHYRLPPGKGMAVKIFLCLSLASGWTPMVANGADVADSLGGETEAPRPYEVAGTLLEMDSASGRVTIRPDLGDPIYLEARKPELFHNLSVGDRLTIQLNGDGQVSKVMGMPFSGLGITVQPAPPQP